MTDGFNAMFIERCRKGAGASVQLIPRMDMVETPDGYSLYCSLGGVKRNDISLGLEGGVLTINAEARLSKLPGKVHALEFSDAVFKGAVDLPQDVDFSRITATFSNGTLTVRLPHARKKNERITVNAG